MSVIKILDYPPPYKAWLTLSNDPDFSKTDTQIELNEFIWGELDLPFSDSLFIKSYNQNLKEQLNLQDHSDLFKDHLFDTLHTWGDYTHTRSKGFDRKDAIEGVKLLSAHNIKPLVWTDHSNFTGNIFHRVTHHKPFTIDGSGNKQINFSYTLDLLYKIGVKYLWDGNITNIIGQNIILSRFKWYSKIFHSKTKGVIYSIFSIFLKPILSRYNVGTLDYSKSANLQLVKYKSEEGYEFYKFTRYGKWAYADIEGLGQILSKSFLNELVKSGGTSVVYTHLGKTNTAGQSRNTHIPENTKASLRRLKKYHQDGKIMLSTLSKLLDYLVIKKNLTLDKKSGQLNFTSDNIRFTELNRTILKEFEFGIEISHPKDLTVLIDLKPTPFSLKKK